MNKAFRRLRVVVFGTRALGFQGLSRLVEEGFSVVGVVTYDYEITEGYTAAEFTEFCKEHAIPCFVTERIHSGPVFDALRTLGFDLGISLYWRRLLKEPLISLAPAGFINAHAADLPRYRGFAATSWAILNGEAYCGLCIHRVVPGIADNGAILRSCRINIDENSTIRDLMEEVTRRAIEMTIEVVREQEAKWPQPLEGRMQDEKKVLLAYPRLPEYGEINWTQTAEEIHRHVRSVTKPYPGAFSWWRGQRIYIWKTRVVSGWQPFVGEAGHIVKYDPQGSVWVLTGNGVIEVQEVSYGDETVRCPGEIVRSVQTYFGMNYSLELEALKARLTKLEERVPCL